MKVEDIKKFTLDCYSKDICYPKLKDNWSETNKSLGMCAITSLIVNDYLGGFIAKITVKDGSHYFNLIENKIIDLTSDQFNYNIDYTNYKIIDRKKILTEDTKNRYNKLKNRLVKKMLEQVDNQVSLCTECGGLVEKFNNDSTVYLGKDQDLMLIGEAPANNGWRKSGMLWRDINGKMLPSGTILQKLFDIIDRNVLETTFLEAVKCYPLERKNLKICSRNCNSIMLKQLEIIKPKLIITLGEFPTRMLLNIKFKNFNEVAGNIYQVGEFKVLPIYHPSPISPKSYKGNVPIFEVLKELKII